MRSSRVDRLAEAFPHRRRRRDVDVAVARGEHAGGRAGRMVVAGLPRHLARHQVARGLEVEHEDLRLQERGLHPLPAPGPLALVERHQDAHGGERAGREIGERGADPHRPAPGLAGHRHQSRHALRDLIDTGPAAIGAVLPEARDARVDEPRIDGTKRVVVDAQARLHVGAVVLDDHVGLRDHAPQHAQPVGTLEIERHAALVAMQVLEVRLVPGGEIGLRSSSRPPPASRS